MQNEQQVRCAIATRLINYRKENELTQKQMARLLSKNRYAYAKYEQRRCTMPLMMALKIADLLSINIYQLIKGVELDSHSCEAA
jgi:transcriptional regulator with XRE-family HTH domain